MQPRVLILRAPGTNCDQETAFAFTTAGGRPDVLHLNRVLEAPQLLGDYQILCLPGGFSYGDDLSAGRIFGAQIRHHLDHALREFKAAGKLILGICNGFQILLKSGILLPDKVTANQGSEPTATLTNNESGMFEDRWVHLNVSSEKCPFLVGIQQMYLPVAHAEGRFVARDGAALIGLESAGQLCLRYAAAPQAHVPTAKNSPVSYPANPNGAQLHVAGVCDETGRVLGLMPHPERHLDPTHHPRWTRETHDRGDGLALFENAVRYFA